jgi:hypothetical protein
LPASPDRATDDAGLRAGGEDLAAFQTSVVRGLVRARPLVAALLLLLVLGPVGWWSLARDEPEPADGVAGPLAAEVAVSDGVMLIRSAACGENTRCGTAFAAELDGEVVLLTNRHVVEDSCSTTAEPWSGGEDFPVREVRLATDADVAVLILAQQDALPMPLTVVTEHAVLLGEPIQVVGFPGALPAVLDGHVQRLEPERLVLAIDAGQGSSGSPVIDAGGAVVGQLYARSSDECCVATPIARVLAAAREAVPVAVCP